MRREMRFIVTCDECAPPHRGDDVTVMVNLPFFVCFGGKIVVAAMCALRVWGLKTLSKS